MKKPIVTLKKISFYERMSEETNCFAADLYIDGKKVGEAKNDGQGGCTDYRGNSKENNEIIRQAEAYFKSLPMEKSVEFNFHFQPSLEYEIDEQFETYLKAQAEKKIQRLINKHSKTAIVFGKPNTGEIRMLNFNRPLSDIHKDVIEMHLRDAQKKYCVNGVVILNTNLKELGITI